MYKSGFVLTSEIHFDNAMFFALPVTVWQYDELIEFGGPIESHNEDAVKINGAYYLKATCEFRIR